MNLYFGIPKILKNCFVRHPLRERAFASLGGATNFRKTNRFKLPNVGVARLREVSRLALTRSCGASWL